MSVSIQPFILASASPRRLALLASVGVQPEAVVPANIDETPGKTEAPRDYVQRVAREKAEAVAKLHPAARILSADTVVVMGRRVLPKAEDEATARACLQKLSGRRHRVLTAVMLQLPGGKQLTKLVESRVQFKRLSESEIEHYIASREWDGKAGGYAIQGLAASYIPWISGSHSAIVGLPLAETLALLAHSSA
jgi:septum formation protein